MKPKPLQIPKTAGAAVDYLFAERATRKRLEAEVAALKTRESEIEDAIFATFKKADLEGARGKRAQASISSSDVPTFDETLGGWDAFQKHLRKHPDDLDLLQRRLSVEAVRERWSLKKAVPGVGVFTKIKLHLTAVKAAAKRPKAKA